MSSFADKLKCCRKALSLSQGQLAAKLSTTKQVISNYELGKRTPKINVAANYAKILNVPVVHLTNDAITYRIWEHADLFEDYYNARPADRSKIIAKYGIDPRIASDYQHIMEIKNLVDHSKNILTPSEESLIYAYRHADDSDLMIFDTLIKKYSQPTSKESAG